MKTFIIATILSAGVLLRPQMAPTVNNQQPTLKSVDIVSVTALQESARQLADQKMNEVIGNGIFDCEWLIEDGVVYGRCCVGFWIFKICAYIEVGRPTPAPQK
jgi:hypothetical protein